MKIAAPLVVFTLLFAFLALGLRRDPHLIPSPLIDQAAPDFELALLKSPEETFSPRELRGKVWLLNAWASWCLSCREEHPLLVALSQSNVVPIYGLNYKDDRATALQWLEKRGDPYVLSAVDHDGRIGIDYGVYGVPETYLIDQAGVIRFKQVGPITWDVLERTILPMVKELSR